MIECTCWNNRKKSVLKCDSSHITCLPVDSKFIRAYFNRNRKNYCTGWRCATDRYEFNVNSVVGDKLNNKKEGRVEQKGPSLPVKDIINPPSPPLTIHSIIQFALSNKIDDFCWYENRTKRPRLRRHKQAAHYIQSYFIGADPYYFFSFVDRRQNRGMFVWKMLFN